MSRRYPRTWGCCNERPATSAIGIWYMLSALVFFLIGGLEAMVMRAQLSLPNLKLLTPELYNQVFTMHGTTMIFLVMMPVLTGFAMYLVPLMIGAPDLAFPRLSAIAFWLQFAGGLLLYVSFTHRRAPDAGWFSYAPLTERTYSPGPGTRLLDVLAGADRRKRHRRGHQPHRHHRHHARSGNDHPAPAAVRLDESGELHHGPVRVARA